MADFDNPFETPFKPDPNRPLPPEDERGSGPAAPPKPVLRSMHVTRVDSETGRLLGNSVLREDSLPSPGQEFLENHHDLKTEFFDVVERVVKARTPHPATLDSDTITTSQSTTLRNLPPGCKVLLEDISDYVTVNDGELELAPTTVGEYPLSIDDAPFIPIKLNVTVTE